MALGSAPWLVWGDGETGVHAEADGAVLAEVVVDAAGAADRVEGAVGARRGLVDGARAERGVAQAAEVLGGDGPINGNLRVGARCGGEEGGDGGDGEQRGSDELHSVNSLAGLRVSAGSRCGFQLGVSVAGRWRQVRSASLWADVGVPPPCAFGAKCSKRSS